MSRQITNKTIFDSINVLKENIGYLQNSIQNLDRSNELNEIKSSLMNCRKI
jgi:hypothetical protein